VRPAPFEYEAAASVAAAAARLHELDGEGKILAGGQSLIPLLNLRLAGPGTLVDIGRVPELTRFEQTPDLVRIGSMVTHAAIEHDDGIRGGWPMLPAAAFHIGHPAIRSRGTVGGSLAHGDPAAEWPVVMVALGAKIVATSIRGERVLPAESFFQSYFTTSLEWDEVITRVDVPAPKFGGWSFLELSRQSGAFAMVMVVAQLDLDEAGMVRNFQIVLGGCGEVPVVPGIDRGVLVGQRPSAEAFAEAGRRVAAVIEPPTDIRATAQDRKQMAAALVARSMEQAAWRAKEASEHA
jgi:aerobic carbon-monoxide dehydrogenase medium subunit